MHVTKQQDKDARLFGEFGSLQSRRASALPDVPPTSAYTDRSAGSVGTVTTLRAACPSSLGSILGRGTTFRTGSGTHPVDSGSCFLRGKKAGT